MKLEFSAGGVIYQKIDNEFKFALILDSYGKWTFPKGHIEKQEKPEQAAMREIQEEIGLNDLKIIELLEKIDYYFKFEENLIHKFVYFYLVESFGKNTLVCQEGEVSDAKWLSPAETMKMIDYKKQNLPILISAFKILGIDCSDTVKSVK